MIFFCKYSKEDYQRVFKILQTSINRIKENKNSTLQNIGEIAWKDMPEEDKLFFDRHVKEKSRMHEDLYFLLLNQRN